MGTVFTARAFRVHSPGSSALNNLGAILLTNPDGTPMDAPGRPAGGYRSLDEVRAALKKWGYSDPACDRILPYLSVSPYETPAEGSRLHKCEQPEWHAPYAPVELRTDGAPLQGYRGRAPAWGRWGRR